MSGCADGTGGSLSRSTSLVELVRARAETHPDRLAYRFFGERPDEQIECTYAQLDRRVRGIAAHFQALDLEGQRALLFFPPGIDFIEAFLGCLYARVIAIPCALPQEKRGLSRVRKIAEDAGTRVALTVSSFSAEMQREAAKLPELAEIQWLAADAIEGTRVDDWKMPALDRDTLGYLQYTSGSTSSPKGVMVSHGNVLHNCQQMKSVWQLDSSDVSFSWLPHFHDMGLLDGITLPLYLGCPANLMAPATFVKQPFRWLDAISRLGATHSGGPNFAYELCVRKISPEQRATLDLSSWRSAYNGSEPVRHETTQAFIECYEPYGFSPQSFSPGYGLAEASLLVSASTPGTDPPTEIFDGVRLARHEAVVVDASHPDAKPLIACGGPKDDMRVEIVSPSSLTRCPSGTIGEIWTKSPSVSQGYWQRPEETERIFQARLADSEEGPWLRTGDLGFFHEGNLYITGRLKDMIIIDGRNIYPTDIEETVERCHRGVRPGFCAAFAHDTGNREHLAVVQELQKGVTEDQFQEIIDTIRRSVAEAHDVPAQHVVLIHPGRLPKTSSGKKQRHAARQGVLEGEIEIVAQSQPALCSEPVAVESAESTEVTTTATSVKPATVASREIESWLVANLSEVLGLKSAEIDPRRPFADYGLTSRQAVSLVGDLESWLKQALPSTLVYDFPTPQALARHLGTTPDVSVTAQPAVDRESESAEPVAIVGIGCRVPGASNPAEFWRLLQTGGDAICEVPADRWNIDAFYDADADVPGKMNTRRGGFLEQVDLFDPQFFGISPREAARMDPQQRLLMEVAWEALEDAGQVPRELAGTNTGVFVGIASQDYGQMQLSNPQLSDAYAGTGSGLSIAANRLSYFFDFHGPSLAVDTACSSSLVAVHAACTSLRRGESTVALAGGVNVILSPVLSVNFTKAGFLAPDGRCKAFDARANGYVRAEGAGMVVLKPLSRAIADGDTVYAVIRGSAVNQDGRSNGLMAPNSRAQVAVLREAYRQAGVSPASIQYVEAHGTGTLLGDPIEANSLGEVLRVNRDPANPCLIGSVKTNIGHLEAGAGIAGLIKVSLMLKHGEIVPSLHFEQPNPHIAFDQLPLRVATELSAWPKSDESPGLAGVSSFGFGGTNAHVVLEEASQQPTTSSSEEPIGARVQLLPISAHSAEALSEMAGKYRDLLRAGGQNGNAGIDFASAVCHTAAVRRTQHDCRLAVLGRTREELAERLDAFAQHNKRTRLEVGRRAHTRKLAFVFSGQGAQWRCIAQSLLSREPVFRKALEKCDDLVGRHADWSLWSMLTGPSRNGEHCETEYIQPALFAVQVALAELWRSWGIVPEAVIGHSVGEVAAACVAGVLDIEDAARIVVHRARLMQQADGHGRMAAIGLSSNETEELLTSYGGRLSVAAVNGPTSTVVSGESTLLEDLLRSLEARRVAARPLEVRCAFHSAQMDPYERELADILKGIKPNAGDIPIFSTVTGSEMEGTEFDATYWGRNLRHPVLFSDTLTRMAEQGFDHFLEISPHPILCGAVRQCLRAGQHPGAAFHSLRNSGDDEEELLATLASLYVRGSEVDWRKITAAPSRPAKLPTYAWQRRRCWLDDGSARGWTEPTSTSPGHAGTEEECGVLGQEIRLAKSSGRRYWESHLAAGKLPAWIAGHTNGSPRIDKEALLEMARAAARACLGCETAECTDVELPADCAIGGAGIVLQTIAELADGGGLQVEICNRPLSEPPQWKVVLRTRVLPSEASASRRASPFYDCEWTPAPQLESLEESIDERTAGQWVILADSHSVGPSLAQQLAALGQQAVIVEPGERFEADGQHNYRVDPAAPGDFERLFQSITGGNSALVRGVVHLWGLDSADSPEFGPLDIQSAERHSCVSAAHLAQAAMALPLQSRPPVWLVTRGSHSLNGDTFSPAVLQSPLWGLGRAWSYEQSDIWGGLVDLDPNATPEDSARAITKELMSRDGEDQVALRGSKRYVPRLVERAHEPAQQSIQLNKNGCYLVTGGLGGLGLEVACHLARRGAGKLVLSGRSAVPPRSQWDELQDDPHWGPRLARLRELESAGVEVKPVSVDVADAKALERLRDELENDGWLPLRGIVHAAGVMKESRLPVLDAELFADILKPKVAGALALESVFAEQPLEFFACFSSASSLLGILGQGLGAYAAGNAFLDAFVQRLRQRGIAAVGINWSMWADVGRAAEDAGIARLQKRGFAPIGLEAGLEHLEQLIAARQPQTLVLPVDWSRVVKAFPAMARSRVFANVLPKESERTQSTIPVPSISRGELLDFSAAERRTRLVEYLAHASARLLGLEPDEFNAEVRLNELGLDSLMAMELKNRIQADLSVRVSVVAILDGYSVAALSDEVCRHIEPGQNGSRAQTPTPEPATRYEADSRSSVPTIEGLVADCESLADDALTKRLDEISEDDVDSLLEQMLKEENTPE